MKRFFAAIFAIALLLTLTACSGGDQAPEPAQTVPPAETSVPTPTPEPTPEPTPDRSPTLSEGAEKESVLSAPFGEDKEGYLFTGTASGSGLNHLNEFLNGAEEYISSFLFTDDGTFTAGKDGYYSLEASKLRFYPKQGETVILTDDLSADGRFVLMGRYLFFRSYLDSDLVRYDLSTGETEIASPGITGILAASDGFIYYGKADGTYRNDSTMNAEVRLFDTPVSYLCVDKEGMCGLTYESEGSVAVLEFRGPDGTLGARAALPELADNMYVKNGRLYVPQAGMGDILVFDIAAQTVLDPIVLTQRQYAYVVVQYVSEEAIYYETVTDGYFPICRTPLTGGQAETVGHVII